jgi:uncharacterized Zn finger protein (UPF0148 family)
MLKNLLREAQQLKNEKIEIAVQADERGYLDRECPSKSCLHTFKVRMQDWHDRFCDEEVFCPLCGHAAPASQWWTTEQTENMNRQMHAYVGARIGNALHRDAKAFNATAPRGFIRMTMKASGSPHAQAMLMPIAAAAVLEQELSCDQCGVGYAVLGAAFFCPCCGHNSVERMFDAALTKVQTKVESIGVVREALRPALGADAAEVFCRSTIEGSLQDCVVAFQHLAERLYVRTSPAKPPRQNAFQALEEGSKLWREALGNGYDRWLGALELAGLNVLFQQRHLLAHRDGLVDERYVQKSGDLTYRAGQRVVVTASDVVRMVQLIKKLAAALRAAARASA